MQKVLLSCQAETERLGECLGAVLRPGDVVLLYGEMGAGKSVLTRSAARSMGIREHVPSPTFNILLIHEGTNLKLYHFDLYRLEDEDEYYSSGLDEFLPPEDGVAFVEWPERCALAMPQDALKIEMNYGEQEGEREVSFFAGETFDNSRIEEVLAAYGDKRGNQR